jgi:hypothetical protein
MNYEILGKRAALIAAALLLTMPALPQGRGGAQAGPPPSPKDAAPMDLTGYWVSIVTEDWRYRMVTPAKGDYASIPLNPEGRKVADTWDPGKDEASGNQCKSYGAAAIMRVPGRLHITWDDVENRNRRRNADSPVTFWRRTASG